MRKFVGVKSLQSMLKYHALKRDAIIFGQIAIPKITTLLTTDTSEYPYLKSELEWLLEKEVIFEPKIDDQTLGKETKSKHKDIDAVSSLLCQEEFTHDLLEKESFSSSKLLRIVVSLSIVEGDYNARTISVRLRDSYQMDAYPIYFVTIPSLHDVKAKKSEVIEIALNALPIPDDSVSWEQILDYRSDPDSLGKYLAIRNWMSELGRSCFTPAEIEEKLEWLIYDYGKHLELHRLKTNVGTLETIVVAGAELLEDIVKFNWGKTAKSLFALKRRHIDLLEGELKHPGREVAYIYNARQRFSRK